MNKPVGSQPSRRCKNKLWERHYCSKHADQERAHLLAETAEWERKTAEAERLLAAATISGGATAIPRTAADDLISFGAGSVDEGADSTVLQSKVSQEKQPEIKHDYRPVCTFYDYYVLTLLNLHLTPLLELNHILHPSSPQCEPPLSLISTRGLDLQPLVQQLRRRRRIRSRRRSRSSSSQRWLKIASIRYAFHPSPEYLHAQKKILLLFAFLATV